MNTLSDTLNDLIKDVRIEACAEDDLEVYPQIIEEYVERIKNELNVEKYLQ